MAFRFSLAALLRFRVILEQVEERKLLSLRQDALRIELAIQQTVIVQLDQRQQRALLLTRAGLTGAGLQFSNACLGRLELGEQQMRQQLLAKQVEIHRQLACFTEARRQREVIDGLRDRELQSYREEERRSEQRQMDELFLLRLLHARRVQARG
jgi:flagellar export protein FliJ